MSPRFERTALLDEHRKLLESWRHKMNLVGPGPVGIHYDDAKLALEGLEAKGLWADLGTGAGFPGIVFAAGWPDVELDLVDSRMKRCMFLEEAIARAGATGITVRCTRIERLEDARYDGIMSRALAAPVDVLKMGRRLLVPGGRLVLFLQEYASIPDVADYRVVREHTYRVEDKVRKAAELLFEPAV